MSDRTACQVIIYDLGGEDAGAVKAALDEMSLRIDFGYGGDDDPLQLGAKYGDEEAALGYYADAAGDLIEHFPKLTFEVWSDPEYEWDGAITMYAPDLGRYDGTCNAEGEPCLTARQVRGSIIVGDTDKTLGLAWLDRIDTLREKVPA